MNGMLMQHWHWFIVVITIAALIGCVWLLLANAKGKPGESTGHVWDGDLREYNNPLPRWWRNLFLITVILAAGYLVFYPGLGNFAGTRGWTQHGQMMARMEPIRAKRQAQLAAFKDKDVMALAADRSAQPLGRELFINNCAGCHGADARGALGFPNLTDNDWLYGGTPDSIIATITKGRQGQMPAFNGAVSIEALNALLELIPRWSDEKLPAAARAAGMQQFAITCAACHGPEGHGNPVLGAPNLTDRIWLHGGSRDQIRETILFGRRGNMPAHANLVSADEIRLVAAYIYGLSTQP